MRSIALAVGASIFCAIALISANAKTDRSTSKCEQTCHDYRCHGGANLMYCHWACQEKCKWEEQMESSDHLKKR
jgi:hypothetical protein